MSYFGIRPENARQQEATMHYEGLQSTDIDNVRALNDAFLTLIRRSPAARERLFGLREDLARVLVTLPAHKAARLAEVPFLLFSLREDDDRFWQSIFEPDPSRDLLASARPAQPEIGQLVAAGLGFIWQLARQNPYALRLLCGASVHWCEQIGEHTLVQILALTSEHQELLVLRLEQQPEIWRKLLDCGVSHHHEVRRAAHISALQALLTQPQKSQLTVWASAACRTRVPVSKVAERDQ